MACEGCDGFTDVIFAVVTTFCRAVLRLGEIDERLVGELRNLDFRLGSGHGKSPRASQTTYSTSPLADATRLGRNSRKSGLKPSTYKGTQLRLRVEARH